jgi:hypothetical protein
MMGLFTHMPLLHSTGLSTGHPFIGEKQLPMLVVQ